MALSLDSRRRKTNDDGFTLIELLIVIIILGVLAAIVVFSVRGIADRGEVTACKTEVRSVETAIEAAYAENGAYPGTVHGLVTAGFLHEDPSGASNIAAGTAIASDGSLPAAAIACP